MTLASNEAREADPLLPDRRFKLALYALISAAALLPLALVDIPPLVDYANHIARLHVIANIDKDPMLAANYTVAWGIMPNLALEAVAYPFLGLLPVEILGRLFIALTFLLLVGGTLWLHRLLHGDIGLWPAAAWLFLYNHLLIMGFLGYLFTLGAALILFAAWIAGERWPVWLRLTLFPAALVALFFGHLFALMAYGLCVAGWEFQKGVPVFRADRQRAIRAWAVAAWQFLPVGLIVLLTIPAAVEHRFTYGPFLAKVRALWSPVLTWTTPIDAALILFVLGVLAVGVATRRLTLAPGLRLPLAIMAVVAVAMPFWYEGIWGSVWYADLRLPLVVALLLVAGLRPRAVSRNAALAVGCAAAVLFTVRIADVAAGWRIVDRDYAEFRAALGKIERGASVLPVQRRDPIPDRSRPPFDEAYWSMAMLAVIDRAAFLPTLFTDPTKQPVRAAPARAGIDTPYGWPVGYALLTHGMDGNGVATENRLRPGVEVRRFWDGWPDRYDYVLVTHFGAAGNPVPARLELVHAGSFFNLYRVVGHGEAPDASQ